MLDNSYNWKSVRYGAGRQVSRQGGVSRWIFVAVILAIACHLIVLLAMQKIPIFLSSKGSEELVTRSVVVRSVADKEYIEVPSEVESEALADPVEAVESLVKELEIEDDSIDKMEIDFSPTMDDVAISAPTEAMALAGSKDSSAADLTSGIDFNESIEDIGSTDDFLKPEVGQLTIDPGKQAADEFDPDRFNTELAKGAGGDASDGVIKGFTPLAQMTNLSQSELEKAKGMIGSDLLFDFNEATLRESAKSSLLKVVLIIDKNPTMKCWIEGHTDLIGSDEANSRLSLARAYAVKDWLIKSMKVSEDRLYVRGLGESQPVVAGGDKVAQAINRRVEIKMRKSAPSDNGIKQKPRVVRKARVIRPLRNPNKEELGEVPAVRRARVVKPPKALLVEDDSVAIESNPELLELSDPAIEKELYKPVKPPRALLVEDDLPVNKVPRRVPPKAVPVE